MSNTFKELAIEKAPKQTVLVDSLTKRAPLLEMMPMQETSNGIQNVYEEIKGIEGAQFVELDEAQPTISVTTEIVSKDLALLGGVMVVGEDKLTALKKSKEQYFADKLPSILKETGMNVEQSLIYNSLRKFAIDNDKALDAGGTADKNYSMVCVTWEEGEITGLYDPASYGDGKAFDLKAIGGGELIDISVYDNSYEAGTLGYGVRIKSFTGLQLASDRYVTAICNNDLTPAGTDTGYTALATEAQIDQMINDAWGDGENTVIYMHPDLLSALNVYKGDKLQVTPVDKNMNRMITYWNDVMIVPTRNFYKGTEVDVTIS